LLIKHDNVNEQGKDHQLNVILFVASGGANNL